MKRCILVLAALGSLLLALAASPAFADGIVSSSTVGQTVTNTTSQQNEAAAVNVPVASGNNVALVNGGNQTSSAGTTQQQGNANETQQTASEAPAPHAVPAPCGCDSTGGQQVANQTTQENKAVAVNAPIASGNNVAVYNGGSQTSSAGTTQEQGNANATDQSATQSGSGGSGQDQTVNNRTSQENKAAAINAPILSGNNVALVNTGDQRSSVGTTQEQGNANATGQSASQSTSGGDDLSQTVKNRTTQENEAVAINAPIASGNNIALYNGGSQTSNAGTTQKQGNLNATDQSATQSASGGSGQDQTVKNQTTQENKAAAINVPILSGNNVALVNEGSQSSDAGTTQQQGNVNSTDQSATQTDSLHDTVLHPCGCDGGQRQTVENSTTQNNEAWALNAPIASGNNLAGYNAGGVHGNGGQTSSVGTEQQQYNVNSTRQDAAQTGGGPLTSCLAYCTSYTCCRDTISNLS